MIRFHQSTIAFHGLVWAAMAIAQPTSPDATKLPNVVVFLVDDLGYMDVWSETPNCFYDTPNIDRFATSAMRFTDGYAQPVCSPTRYSLITGKYPTRVEATNFFLARRLKVRPAELNNNMPLDENYLAACSERKGYATFFAGKWHLGEDEAHYPQNFGFDVNMVATNEADLIPANVIFLRLKPAAHPDSPQATTSGSSRPRDGFVHQNQRRTRQANFSPTCLLLRPHAIGGRPDLVEKYELKPKRSPVRSLLRKNKSLAKKQEKFASFKSMRLTRQWSKRWMKRLVKY